MAPKLALAAALAMPAISMAAAVPRQATIQVVGGDAAEIGEFPWIVSLSEGYGHFCGGTLINAYTVITAAHCNEDVILSNAEVLAGTNDRTTGGVTARVSKIIDHPEYDSTTYNNDIGIWQLAEPIEESELIQYATLPKIGSDPIANSTATVAGWGALNEGDSDLPEDLQRVDVPIVSRQHCQAQYAPQEKITQSMICAGIEEGGIDSCQGDSGGPLTKAGTDTLIGVVSWGYGCAAAGYSGVYARVSEFIPWITENTVATY